MANNIQLEAAGDLESWPPNEPGKATQVAVFGMYHPNKGKCCVVLWTGQFPSLEAAMYWGAKKELEAVRKGKWYIASRVLWQHELSPEQAVDACRKKMQAQVDDAIAHFHRGDMPTLTQVPGGLRPILPGDGHARLVEIEDPDSPGDSLSAWIPAKPGGK
jgi:hypothetical protein